MLTQGGLENDTGYLHPSRWASNRDYGVFARSEYKYAR